MRGKKKNNNKITPFSLSLFKRRRTPQTSTSPTARPGADHRAAGPDASLGRGRCSYPDPRGIRFSPPATVRGKSAADAVPLRIPRAATAPARGGERSGARQPRASTFPLRNHPRQPGHRTAPHRTGGPRCPSITTPRPPPLHPRRLPGRKNPRVGGNATQTRPGGRAGSSPAGTPGKVLVRRLLLPHTPPHTPLYPPLRRRHPGRTYRSGAESCPRCGGGRWAAGSRRG